MLYSELVAGRALEGRRVERLHSAIWKGDGRPRFQVAGNSSLEQRRSNELNKDQT